MGQGERRQPHIALAEVSEDGHIPVFPAHLVELDLEWRVRKSQGLNYRTDIAEFEMERDRLFAQSWRAEGRLHGSAQRKTRWVA